ncbi:MAG: 3-deoxy-manno-octulosonate cytidylyltransferase [Chloroflexi bacterium]|nr:3-deoxy-manno-octulosonate cytidylyltransferase [Chloroflexota bacterium]|tara:strand:+ start:2254 stop:3057 length:804 start_codon:yes stop_codon:yes gene_type:complete
MAEHVIYSSPQTYTREDKMASVIAIPARLESTRFPRKVLCDINGRPMLWHVWHNVLSSKEASEVWILTDSEEIQTLASEWGASVVMTSSECTSGTDRIAEGIDAFGSDTDIIVNVQADEPLIRSDVIDNLIIALHATNCDIATPVYKILDPDDLTNPNVVKVVRDNAGLALYFSRTAIPHIRDADIQDWVYKTQYWGHPGIYAYRRQSLINYIGLPEGNLEQVEKLEQLRLLESGKCIQTVEVNYRPLAVDRPEDLQAVLRVLNDGD